MRYEGRIGKYEGRIERDEERIGRHAYEGKDRKV